MKRFLASLLAVVMLVSLLPVSAFAAQTKAADTQEPAEIVSQQLVLGDNLNMRFYVKANSNDAVVNVTVGKGSTKSIALADAQQDKEGNAIVDVTLSPAQMTDTIALQGVAGDVTGAAKQYTVLAYAKKILQGNYGEQTTGLVRAMLNYGGYSQVYFNYNNTPEQLANKDCKDVYTEALPAELEVTMDGAMDGVQIYGATLVLRDRIALRYYFTGSSEGITVDSGDKPHAVVDKNGQFYVELANINPQDYSTNYTVTLTKGEEALSLTYSVMHYVTRKGITGSEDLQNLLKALFAYHNAAITYNEWIADCDNLAEYTLVYGDNATDNEKTARDMIADYIKRSTGLTLPMIPASQANYNADAKYVVIGNTGLGNMTPASDLGYRGYQIKTQDNSVFVCGGTDYGTLCGAIGFLERVINLQAYGHKVVNYDKKDELMIDAFDLTVIPDINMEQPPFAFVTSNSQNMALWGIGQKMFGLIEGSQNHWHNSFDYLPPKDYALTHPEYYTWDGLKPVQLSYTANGNARAFDEMTTICADKIIAAAEADPSLKALTLTQEDSARKWDDSAKAKELYNKYGTNTAGLIIFMNAVADKVKERLPEGRELDIYFFSYFLTYEPPVKLVDGKYVAIDSEVELRDNVGVMFAPIDDDFSTTDFYSTDMYRQLCGWAALTDNLALWTYQTNFDDYFVFYNSFNTYSDIYKTAAELGVKYSYDQGQWNQATAPGFSDLKAYVIGQLSWDADANLNDLFNAYFPARFGSASDEMRTLFNEMRSYFDQLKATYNIDGGINESDEYLRADRFEKSVLERWLGYIEAALAKADNGAIRQHILLESLAVRYMWIELYGDTLAQGERIIAIYEFKKDCTELFVNMWTEGKPIEKLWDRWENASMTVIDGYYYNFDLSLNQASYEIALPAEAQGKVVGVYDANYKTLEGVTIGENSITVSVDAVAAMAGEKGYGDSYLHLTTADTIYKIKVAVVTKMISSYADLYAIKAYQVDNKIDGYFALANDFDATGEDPICLIDFAGYINNKENSGVGFYGIFDGRGHTISGLTAKTGGYAMVGGLFGQILEGAIIRNVAFENMTTDGVKAYTYLLTGESCRMTGTIHNVVISAKGDVAQAFGMVGCDANNTANPIRFTMRNVVISGVDNLAFTLKLPHIFENVILVSDEGVVKQMSASYEDEKATNSVIRYASNDELFTALAEENIIAEWEDSDITFENTAINFNGKAIITEHMNVVETEAVIGTTTELTIVGNVDVSVKDAIEGVTISGNALTVANSVKEGTKVTLTLTSKVSGVSKDFAIVLHRNYTDAVLGAMDVELGYTDASLSASGISGNAECLSYGATTVYEGYTIADGKLTVSKDLLDAMYLKLGLGEHNIYLGTDASVRYAITLTFTTKIINTVEDLESISTTEATLDGYYILNADLDFAGREPFALLAGKQSCYNVPDVGFKGTFDGRGHIISNLTTCNGSYRQLGGVFGQICAGAVVKNVAFVNIKNINKNASNIGFLLSGDASNLYGTVENVAIIAGDVQDRVFSILRNASGKLNNCLFLNVNMINSEGNSCQISNVMSVTASGHNYGGFAWSGNATFNAQPNFAATNDMFLSLMGENIFENWGDTLFSYADGQIFFGDELLVQYDLDLNGESKIFRGTEQTYTSNDSDLELKEEIDGVSFQWTDTDENDNDIYTLSVDASVPEGTQIVIVAYSWDFETVTEELVVTVKRNYQQIDLTAEGNKADVTAGNGAEIAISFAVEGISYGDTDVITEGVSYADGKLTLTKEAVAAIIAKVGLGEKTLKLYTAEDKCYSVIVTFATKFISSYEDLVAIKANKVNGKLDGYYALSADIDATGTAAINLVEHNDYINNKANSHVGFYGTFDGRGHTITGLTVKNGAYAKVGGLFGQILNGAVVKNVAFVDMSTDGSTSHKYLLTGESGRMTGTIENVAISAKDNATWVFCMIGCDPNNTTTSGVGTVRNLVVTGVDYLTLGIMNNPNVSNVIVAANKGVMSGSVAGVGNTSARDKITVYNSNDAMFTALDAANAIEGWNCDIAYASGELLFNGKVVAQASVSLEGTDVIIRGTTETYTSNGSIAIKNPISGVSIADGVLSVDYSVPVDTVITLVATHSKYASVTVEKNVTVSMVYEQINLTGNGLIGDLETSGSYSFIKIPAEIVGTIDGISYGEAARYTGVSVSDGELAVPKAFVTEIYNALGYGEHEVKLYTTADKCYTVKMGVVTKAIDNFAELQSISTTNDTLDGYYVLTQDIGCGSEPITLLAGKQSTFGSANIPGVGFKGTFDGRGHIISNLTTTNGGYRQLGGFFGQICAGAVVKNVAFVNMTSETTYLLVGDGSILHGTLENVVVISKDSAKIALTELKNVSGKINNCFFANVKQISTSGGSAKVSNVLSVTGNAASNYGGFSWTGVANYNAQPNFASMDALYAGLNSNNVLANWENALLTYENGKLLFNGTPLFFEEVVLANPVNLGDVSTVAKQTVIDVPAQISGNIIGISTATTGRASDGVTYADGKLALEQKAVENLASGGWGNTSLKIYTDEGKVYSVSVCLVTKIITNQADLQSLATGKTLDGYFVLANDIECDGTTQINFSTYATDANTGFIGTFDGRGHTISNVNVGAVGLFNCTGKGTVKNLAVVNAVGTARVLCINANGTTFENVYVSSNSCLRAIEYAGNCTIKNMIAVLPNGQNVILTYGAAAVNNTISNVYSVIAVPTTNSGWSGTKVVGFFQNYYKNDDPKTLYNLKHYTTVADLLTAMGAGDMLSGWSYFSFADGKLSFGDNVVVQ